MTFHLRFLVRKREKYCMRVVRRVSSEKADYDPRLASARAVNFRLFRRASPHHRHKILFLGCSKITYVYIAIHLYKVMYNLDKSCYFRDEYFFYLAIALFFNIALEILYYLMSVNRFWEQW